jgi:hypothetical protein
MSLSRILRVCAGLAFVIVFLPGSATPTAAKPASHVQPGSYSGTTSQGQFVGFNVVEGGANDFIDSWSIGFNLKCGKSGRTPGVGHGFGGFHVDIDPTTHKFAFSYDGAFYFYFQWDGEFTSATTANGHALVNWGGIYRKKRAEACKSGNVTWTADHDGPGAKPDLSKVDVFFRITRNADGSYKVEQIK